MIPPCTAYQNYTLEFERKKEVFQIHTAKHPFLWKYASDGSDDRRRNVRGLFDILPVRLVPLHRVDDGLADRPGRIPEGFRSLAVRRQRIARQRLDGIIRIERLPLVQAVI